MFLMLKKMRHKLLLFEDLRLLGDGSDAKKDDFLMLNGRILASGGRSDAKENVRKDSVLQGI